MIVPGWCATVQLCQVPRRLEKNTKWRLEGAAIEKNVPYFKFFSRFGPALRKWKGSFLLFLSPTLLGPCEDPEFRPIILVLKFYLVS